MVSTRNLLAQNGDSEIVGAGEERRRAKLARTTESGSWLWRGGREILASYTTTSFLCLRSHGFRGKQGRGVNCTAYATYFMGVCPKSRSGITQLWRRVFADEKRWACLASEGSNTACKQRGTRKASHVFLCPLFSPHTIKAHTHRHGVHAGSHPFRSSPGLDSVVPLLSPPRCTYVAARCLPPPRISTEA